METNKTRDDGKTPITLENLHEVFSSVPSDEWEKSRKFLKQKMAESHKFWEERKQKEQGHKRLAKADRFFYSKSSVINDFKQFYFEIQA